MVLKESQLKELIKECVKQTILKINEGVDEINGTGRSYADAKNAYLKMRELGQMQRAKKFKKTYNDLSDDPNSELVANYSFDDDDTVSFHKRDMQNPTTPASQYDADHQYDKPVTVYRGGRDVMNNNWRTENPKTARDIASHISNIKPDTQWNRNDFRA